MSAFTAAPHRMLFTAGMAAAAVSGAWWAVELLGRSWPLPLPVPKVAPIWAHAWLMLYALFGPFIFGFLFTTYPRWMNGPLVPRRAYVSTFALFLVSLALAFAGIWTGTTVFTLGVLAGCLAWLVAWIALLRVLLDSQQVVAHAVVSAVALGLGTISQFLYAFALLTPDPALLHTAPRLVLWCCLLPVAFAVSHRMLPFFTASAVPGYEPYRPLWWLVAGTALFIGHQALAIAGRFEWLWLPDAALALLTGFMWLRWRPLASRGIPLLWTLHAAFLWLPLGLALQAVASASFALSGDWLVGRAPLHALGMGFLGSLVLAMVTRVTLGHSGRPLAMDRLTVGLFLALQLAVLARVGSELALASNPGLFTVLLLASVTAWLVGWLPWVARHAPMLVVARVDGRPG
ncbi:MAG: NnrS family protein [Steroidobacteraceae bacterium]|jgi:uncharacterized protein involved in response to NO|nr:NnrS family protein [Steroidobacteraceae bacterium]